MTAPFRHPRAVIPMRATIYEEARKIALSAENDWPRLLGAAQTLSQSPDWTDTSLARHIRTAHSLHLAGLLKPIDPKHHERGVLIDKWRAQAIANAQDDTALDVLRTHRDRWPEILIGAAFVAVVILKIAGWA